VSPVAVAVQISTRVKKTRAWSVADKSVGRSAMLAIERYGTNTPLGVGTKL
jgi:hypothetical protein